MVFVTTQLVVKQKNHQVARFPIIHVDNAYRKSLPFYDETQEMHRLCRNLYLEENNC